jgi:hypothetical protein
MLTWGNYPKTTLFKVNYYNLPRLLDLTNGYWGSHRQTIYCDQPMDLVGPNFQTNRVEKKDLGI